MSTHRSYPDPAPQDPDLGIDRANIVPRLSAENWNTKAVVRLHPAGWVYLWITRFELHPGQSHKKHGGGYAVRAVGQNGGYARVYQQEFESIEAALAYVNGDAEGKLAAETRSLDDPGAFEARGLRYRQWS